MGAGFGVAGESRATGFWRRLHGLPRRCTRPPLSDANLAAGLRQMDQMENTVHAFRSTFGDWAGDETVSSREFAEATLAHALGDKAEQARRRETALEKRREMMKAWGGSWPENIRILVELYYLVDTPQRWRSSVGKKNTKASDSIEVSRLIPSSKTLRSLYLRSGNLCAMNGCENVIINNAGVMIGEVCHIAAAKPDGPRLIQKCLTKIVAQSII